jgi:hypothetical protein
MNNNAFLLWLRECEEIVDVTVDRAYLIVPSNVHFEEETFLVWDSLAEVEKKPEEIKRCLWDFRLILDADAEGILRFVSEWGLFDWGMAGGRVKGWMFSNTDDWLIAALRADLLLRLIVATESEELASDDLMSKLALLEGESLCELFEIVVRYDLDARDQASDREPREVRASRLGLERWRQEQRRGSGLDVQRGIASLMAKSWMDPLIWTPEWRTTGRHLKTVAYGVRDIVAAQLLAIFSARELDVLVCSVCGQLYDFSLAGKQRRPRRGVRSLCSPECAIDAKRADNRVGWHRNKDKWSKHRKGV